MPKKEYSLSSPYGQFEASDNFKTIKRAVNEVAQNGDIDLLTTDYYPAGYICEALHNAKPKTIYVSGPYTKGDPCINTHNAIEAGNKLLDAGFIPFIPHLSHFWHTMTPRHYDDWMKIDLAFLPQCKALLRLSGESRGADIEMAEAEKQGIPVYHLIEELIKDER